MIERASRVSTAVTVSLAFFAWMRAATIVEYTVQESLSQSPLHPGDSLEHLQQSHALVDFLLQSEQNIECKGEEVA